MGVTNVPDFNGQLGIIDMKSSVYLLTIFSFYFMHLCTFIWKQCVFYLCSKGWILVNMRTVKQQKRPLYVRDLQWTCLGKNILIGLYSSFSTIISL